MKILAGTAGGFTVCREMCRAAGGNASRVPSPRRRRRRRDIGFGASRCVIAFTAALNNALMAPMPLVSADVRGWFLIPPSCASQVARLSRVSVTSIPPLLDAVFDFTARLCNRRFLRRLGVGHFKVCGDVAFELARVGVLARRRLRFAPRPGRPQLGLVVTEVSKVPIWKACSINGLRLGVRSNLLIL
jgi:hypothetical protein